MDTLVNILFLLLQLGAGIGAIVTVTKLAQVALTWMERRHIYTVKTWHACAISAVIMTVLSWIFLSLPRGEGFPIASVAVAIEASIMAYLAYDGFRINSSLKRRDV